MMFKTLVISTYEFCYIKNLSLKYQRFTPSGCKDIESIYFENVSKTQFLCKENEILKCKRNKGGGAWKYLNK